MTSGFHSPPCPLLLEGKIGTPASLHREPQPVSVFEQVVMVPSPNSLAEPGPQGLAPEEQEVWEMGPFLPWYSSAASFTMDSLSL